ncbi:MAG TPA: enoyl-CoA hydratase-related protein [Thermoanaerobaculia bacterium]|nr:enoyl-CoA hydratase-related protein [Thermoanaerobaculia bacterium]
MSLVSVENRDGIALVSLDRPPANAFSADLVARLDRAFADSGNFRAIVLTSASPKIFSGGWDLTVVSKFARAEMQAFYDAYCGLVRRIFAHATPIVAALPGHAIAGGMIVAAAADERFVAEGPARLGLSEVALGVPLPACCVELFRFVLGARGMERLTASAENVPVDRALAMGLADRAVAPADLEAAALERAAALSRGSPQAYAETKRRARAETLERFDAARRDDPFLDYWFSPDARTRIGALVERLSKKG